MQIITLTNAKPLLAFSYKLEEGFHQITHLSYLVGLFITISALYKNYNHHSFFNPEGGKLIHIQFETSEELTKLLEETWVAFLKPTPTY